MFPPLFTEIMRVLLLHIPIKTLICDKIHRIRHFTPHPEIRKKLLICGRDARAPRGEIILQL